MEEDIPDFSDSTTVSNNSIITEDYPDFSSAQDVGKDISKVKVSPIARFMRRWLRTPLDDLQLKQHELEYIKENGPTSNADFKSVVDAYEEDKAREGIIAQLEGPMMLGMGAGGLIAPISTAVATGAFAVKDHFFNARRVLDEKAPNTPVLLKDAAEILDFVATAGIIGKSTGLFDNVGTWAKSRFNDLNLPKTVNIKAEEVQNIQKSLNLLPEEKLDISNTLGIKQNHIDASIKSNLPINVPVNKVIDLAEKPYWERTKSELGIKYNISEIEPGNATKPIIVDKTANQELISKIKSIQSEKNLSNTTVAELKRFINIDNVKSAETNKLKELKSFMDELKNEDKFLTEKQIKDLKDIIKDVPNIEVTPKRIIVEKFGDKEEVLSTGIMSKVANELVPTVDIKQGNPLIQKVVNDAKDKLAFAAKEVDRRNKNFDEMLSLAEKSRSLKLSMGERLNRSLLPQNKEIFRALSGEKVELTKEEVAVVAYLKNFFNMARKDLSLEKYRKNYVTHIEKSLTEKILNYGINNAIKDSLSSQKNKDLPVDILLELENIIGSEKFFKFALERKGGVDPTTNLRQIVNTYSNMYETKKALDQILPEGQAITKNLLKGKNALWMKRFLQNLKGRGLDNNFRNGKMGWLAKLADGIIDVGYQKMLGLNWKSALKNVVAGESNSWIYQDFPSYLKGKQRFLSDPKKAYEMAKEYGILEGTFSEYSQKGIGKLKKLQDLSMAGQRAGEIEVRSSILTSMLSDKEWQTGKISKEKVQEINDLVAITQGVFSKVDSPLILQTWYGRMFFQMNRWRITNALLARRITNDAFVDIRQGKYNTQNTTKFGKMILAYGIGMYIANELYKAGYKSAGDVAKNMANIIDGNVTLFSQGELIKMFTDNPTLSMFKELSNTIIDLANYLHVPGSKKARDKGIEDTYLAPIESTKDLIDVFEQ